MAGNNRFEIGMLKNYVNDNKTNYCYVLEVTSDARHLCNLLNQLNNKNEQLKKRNNNQYNQLNELWQIIEEENWEKLIAMKKQLKEDEERLQQEWKCYE